MVQTGFSKGRRGWSLTPTNPHSSPVDRSQAQRPNTDITCPVSWHFPGRARSLILCYCNCTKEALGERELPWKHLKAG